MDIIMKTTVFVMAIILQAVCEGPECEIFPRYPWIKHGSELRVTLRTPPNGNCRKVSSFDTSRLYWTLNNQRIPKSFYHFNSTSASVTFPNFTLAKGTVECNLDKTVLNGTTIRTYTAPENVSCVVNIDGLDTYLTCKWDHNQHDVDTNYTVLVKQGGNESTYQSGNHKFLKIAILGFVCFEQNISVIVTAQYPAGEAPSEAVTYANVCALLQLDPPSEVQVKPKMTGLSVTWRNTPLYRLLHECEVRFLEKGFELLTFQDQDELLQHVLDSNRKRATEFAFPSHTSFPRNSVKQSHCVALTAGDVNETFFLCIQYCAKPVVKTVDASSETLDLPEVKPCTNYTVSVRCRPSCSVTWSNWSLNVTRLTSLNVSSVQLHLWRSQSVVSDLGKREFHLMWKGIHPSCKAFDEYRLFDRAYDLVTSRSFKPSENHTIVSLDGHAHRFTVAALRDNESLSEVSIEIPSTAEEKNQPPVTNVSMYAQDGQIHVNWEKPCHRVTGYLIIWNSTEKDHRWQQTQERHFSLKGKSSILYSISLMPVYENGLGSEVRLHNYAQEGGPKAVSHIRAESISDRKAEIHWQPVLPTQCCAFVVNYTVFYKTQNDLWNVTVDKYADSVILDDLQPKTTYIVYVQTNSMAASVKSDNYTFSTKPYGEAFLITVIVCSAGLMLLSVCTVLAVLIRREYLSEKVPNPRFSSLSIWSTQRCRNPWNQLPMPWGCDSEKSLTCQVETEDYSILATSITDVAKQNTAIQEMTPTNIKNTALVSSAAEMELPSDRKEERTKSLSVADLQTPHSIPINKSPYRNQSTATSPVDLPRTVLQGTAIPCSSEETVMLLKPQLHNTTLLTTYVTVDMFEHGKGPSK